MGPVMVVLINPNIQILLKFFNIVVDLLSKSHRIEFVLYGTMEALTNAVGLRTFGFCLTMVYILNGQIKLIFMMLPGATIFSASIS